MEIKLETLSLTRYDEQQHKTLKEDFEKGSSTSEYIHQIGNRLENSSDNHKMLYQSAFVVSSEKEPIGYLFISSMIHDEVFLEYAILNNYRNRGYTKRLVNETSDYLFENCNIKSVRLTSILATKKALQ